MSHLHVHYVPLKAQKESFWKLGWGAVLAQIKPALTAEEMLPLRLKLQQAMQNSDEE